MISIQVNETLNLQLTTAVTVDVVLSYADYTAVTLTANGGQTTISTTANTTILEGPASGTQRQLKFLSIRNRDVVTTGLTLKKNVAAVEYLLTAPIILKAGESLQYQDQSGFLFYDSNGRTHLSSLNGPQQAGGVFFPVVFGPYGHLDNISNPTGARILHADGETVATYIGRAPKTSLRMMVKYRTCNASATVTWGELAIATGTPILGGGTTLTVIGVNTTNNAIANSFPAGVNILQGTYSNYIDVAPGQTLQEGDDTWILIGGAATTGANIRCVALGDALQSGCCVKAVTRPSLNIGKGVVYDLEDAANLSPYISVSYT